MRLLHEGVMKKEEEGLLFAQIVYAAIEVDPPSEVGLSYRVYFCEGHQGERQALRVD